MNTHTNVKLLRFVDDSRFPSNQPILMTISDGLKTTAIRGRLAIIGPTTTIPD